MKANIKRSKADDKVNLYTTPEWAVSALVKSGELEGTSSWWECCCGMGHISEALKAEGVGASYLASDLHDHGYGIKGEDFFLMDFLSSEDQGCDLIITNPPFDTQGTHFAMLKHALAMPSVKKVAFFMPVQFLETKDRAEWLELHQNMTKMYSFADRVKCLTKGDPKLSKDNTAKHFAWFIFEPNYKGDAVIKHLYKPDSMRRKRKQSVV